MVDESGVPTDLELVGTLKQVMGCLHAHLERTVQGEALPKPCAIGLAMIDGAVSMKQLGKQMRCDPSFITVVADELEERGLAKRAVDADDRRVKNLVLTRKGSALRTELTQRFAEAPALRCLDDRQRTDLAGLLRTMLDADAAACEPTGTPEPVAADAATGGRRQRAPARSAPR